MDFLGIGPLELLVILVLILIVVGPGRLPQMAAQLARFIRTFRRYAADVTQDFNATMKELEEEYDDMQGEWKEVGQGLEEGVRAIGKEVEAAGDEAHKALKEADRETRKALEAAKPPADEPSEPVPPSH